VSQTHLENKKEVLNWQDSEPETWSIHPLWVHAISILVPSTFLSCDICSLDSHLPKKDETGSIKQTPSLGLRACARRFHLQKWLATARARANPLCVKGPLGRGLLKGPVRLFLEESSSWDFEDSVVPKKCRKASLGHCFRKDTQFDFHFWCAALFLAWQHSLVKVSWC